MSTNQSRATSKIDSFGSLLETARSLVPKLRAGEEEEERQRSLSADSISMLRDAGLYKVLQPLQYGGMGGDLVDFVQLALEVGRGSGSMAWVYGNICLHSWIIGMFPKKAQDEFWADPNAIASSCLRPAGVTEKVEGGYKISGRWPYVSGCDHTGWTVLGAMFPGEGGSKQPGYMLVPRSHYDIVDEWMVTGLAATGSKDLVIKEAFVPDYLTLTAPQANSGKPPGLAVHGHPIYQVPLFSSFSFFIAGPIVGMSIGAFDQYVDYVKSRATAGGATGGGELMGGIPTIQLRVGEAQMCTDAASALLLSAASETMASATAGLTVERRIANRRAHSMSTQLAVNSIDLLNEATGATGILTGDPIQRGWRNIHAGAKHFSLNWDAVRVMSGQHALGIDPKLRMF